MFEKFVYKMLASIGENAGISTENCEKASYGFLALFYTIIGILFVVIIASLVNVLFTAILTMTAFVLLRNFSGGFHSQSPIICITVSAVIFPLAGKASYFIISSVNQTTEIISIATFIYMIAIITIYFRAPLDTPNKPITSIQQKNKLRKLSFITVTIIYGIALISSISNPLITISLQSGVLLQVILLPPFKLNKKIKRKEGRK